jgi:thymidylate synthase
VIEAASNPDAFARVAAALAAHGVVDTTRRGVQTMVELPGPTVVELSDPLQYMPLSAARRCNPWVSLAEFPWLMQGSNRIAWLQRFLPRAAMFSDDGVSWRAGYGPRLAGRVAGGGHGSQVQRVIEQLRVAPGSRQAIIALWYPHLDMVDGSRDYPCTISLHFTISNDRLDCHCHMRSNDVVWGMSGVNMVNWPLLQHGIARQLGVGVGSYFHIADNLHTYERHQAMMARAAFPINGYDDPYPCINGESVARAAPDLSQPGMAAFDEAIVVVERFIQRGTYRNVMDPEVLASHINGGMGQVDWLPQWMHLMLLHGYVDPASNLRLAMLAEEGGASRLERLLWHGLSGIHVLPWAVAVAAWMARGTDPINVAVGAPALGELLGPAAAGLYLEAMDYDTGANGNGEPAQ